MRSSKMLYNYLYVFFSVTIPTLLFLILCCSYARVLVVVRAFYMNFSPFDQLMIHYFGYLSMYIL